MLTKQDIARQNAAVEMALNAGHSPTELSPAPVPAPKTRPFSPAEIAALPVALQQKARAGTLQALASAPPANLVSAIARGSVMSLSAHKEQERFDAQLRTELGVCPPDEMVARQVAAREQASEVRLMRNMLSGNCDSADAQYLSAHPLERNTDQLIVPPEIIGRIVRQVAGDAIEPKEVAATIGRVYQANAGQAFSVGAALASPLMALGITSANVDIIVESIGDLQADLASKLPAIVSSLSVMTAARQENTTDQLVLSAIATPRNEVAK